MVHRSTQLHRDTHRILILERTMHTPSNSRPGKHSLASRYIHPRSLEGNRQAKSSLISWLSSSPRGLNSRRSTTTIINGLHSNSSRDLASSLRKPRLVLSSSRNSSRSSKSRSHLCISDTFSLPFDKQTALSRTTMHMLQFSRYMRRKVSRFLEVPAV